MKFVNGLRVFALELNERELSAIRVLLGTGQYDQVQPIITSIDTQIKNQSTLTEGAPPAP